MTLLAGVFSRRPDRPIDDALCVPLRAALSRHPGEAVATFRDARCFLAKVDVGAYRAPAFLIDGASAVSMLCGEPLLTLGSDAVSRTRDRDLAVLHREWRSGHWGALTAAQGVFSAAHYAADAGTLTLATDKLGIRPLYYWLGPEYVIFASALRLLESLTPVPKVMDVRSVTELASFGFSVSDRTPYVDIRVLKPAEILEVSGQGVRRQRYWRWDRVEPSHRPEPALVRNAHEQFTAAVRRRSRNDSATTAFLSGGLDSRCVVTAVRAQGVAVHSVNFGLPGSQDQVFGAALARQLGTAHEEVPMQPALELKWSLMMAEALARSPQRSARQPERPGVVWSGDGGSCAVGHIYVSRAVVDLLRASARDDAIAQFLHEWGAAATRRLLQPRLADTIAAIPAQAMREELAELECSDPARAFHLFLMLNGQRRLLAGHFEDMDLHRLELHLPFFDSAFLESILCAPVDLCLHHGLYAKWLACFPPVMTSVPWQTYPGHVPCPIPHTQDAGYQWDSARFVEFHAEGRRQLLRRAREILDTSDFPHAILRKPALRLATWICRSGIRDYSYVLTRANTYYRYWSRSRGHYALPG